MNVGRIKDMFTLALPRDEFFDKAFKWVNEATETKYDKSRATLIWRLYRKRFPKDNVMPDDVGTILDWLDKGFSAKHVQEAYDAPKEVISRLAAVAYEVDHERKQQSS